MLGVTELRTLWPSSMSPLQRDSDEHGNKLKPMTETHKDDAFGDWPSFLVHLGQPWIKSRNHPERLERSTQDCAKPTPWNPQRSLDASPFNSWLRRERIMFTKQLCPSWLWFICSNCFCYIHANSKIGISESRLLVSDCSSKLDLRDPALSVELSQVLSTCHTFLKSIQLVSFFPATT